jgi:hypothetical protein
MKLIHKEGTVLVEEWRGSLWIHFETVLGIPLLTMDVHKDGHVYLEFRDPQLNGGIIEFSSPDEFIWALHKALREGKIDNHIINYTTTNPAGEI